MGAVAVFDNAIVELGPIDTLVNNAGIIRRAVRKAYQPCDI
jgi:2-deoxy-D-gluconate 3-dehydrogenase